MLWDAECKDETPPPPPAGGFLFFTRKLYKILRDSAEAASAFTALRKKKKKKKRNWLLSFSPVRRISQADTPDVSNTQKQRHLRSDWGEPSSRVLFKRELSISIPVEPVSKNATGFLMERGAGLGEGPHWSARINPAHCCLFIPLIGLDISQLLNDSGWRFSYKGSARVLAQVKLYFSQF